MVLVKQGNMELQVCLLEESKRPLKAPKVGDMARIIHESAACLASYRFSKGGRTIFEFETDRASFEFEYFSGS